jgi:transcriptional regulator with XRE-family HTH domain
MVEKSQYTEDERSLFQKRFSYFLKKVRDKKGISSKKMALNLGYAPSRYSKIEGEVVYPRLIHSLELLKTFAALEDMAVHEFVAFLEGTESLESSPRFLRKWEEKTLTALRKLNMISRRNFVNALGSMARSERELLEGCLGLFADIRNNKGDSILKALITILEKVKK